MASKNSIQTVYEKKYGDNVVFYWTVWGHTRVPLIKYGDIFVPVQEHHTQILLAVKIIAAAKLCIQGESTGKVHEDSAVSRPGMIVGEESSHDPGLDWTCVVFAGNVPLDFEHYRNHAERVLYRLVSNH